MKPLKTSGTAARELGVSESTVRHFVRTGQLPDMRDEAGRHLFKPEDVEKLKQAREYKQKR